MLKKKAQWFKAWACLQHVTTADFFQEKKKGTCLEVSHMTSSQISVSKASHRAMLNFKAMEKCNPTMYPKEREEYRCTTTTPRKKLRPHVAHSKHPMTGSCCYYHDY